MWLPQRDRIRISRGIEKISRRTGFAFLLGVAELPQHAHKVPPGDLCWKFNHRTDFRPGALRAQGSSVLGKYRAVSEGPVLLTACQHRGDEFAFALFRIAFVEGFFCDPVRAHCFFPEFFRLGAGRPAGEEIHSRCERTGFDAARGGDEVDLAAHFADDAHVDRHGWGLSHGPAEAHTKGKGRGIGYALATSSCEGVGSVDACTVAAPDAITAFAVPNPGCSSQSKSDFSGLVAR
jgi:hypothetical protein